MKPYIYGARNGITIFDLRATMKCLAAACDFLRDTVAAGGTVLFVAAKRQAQEAVREAAQRTGMFYMCDRWLGGTLTNNRVILSRVAHMKHLQKLEADGPATGMTKKELARVRRDREKLERTLGGIQEMRRLPSVLVVVDTMHEAIAVREASRVGVPVVGILDSNCDPDPIEYVVPGNDDALKSIRVFIDAFAAAVEEGRQVGAKRGPAAETAATAAADTAARPASAAAAVAAQPAVPA
jgi:small subunit ribosomal protein S2